MLGMHHSEGSIGQAVAVSTPARDRADRCPGVFRPWPAEDGALVRLRLPGGHTSRRQLASLLDVAREFGDGQVHLTQRANLQLRALPTGEHLPTPVVEAIRATGLLPHPTHELVRNIVASPLSGLPATGSRGRADLRPIVTELDEQLCSRECLAQLPGRFLFVLDDGSGDVIDRRLDLGLVAVDDRQAQLRIGEHHWGGVVPLARAAAELITLAVDFVQERGSGPHAPWHVDELDRRWGGQPRDIRTQVSSPPPGYGELAEGVVHVPVPGGVLNDVRGLPERLVLTPWKTLVAIGG